MMSLALVGGALADSTITITNDKDNISINGKTREVITVSPEASEDEVKKAALSNPRVQSFLEGKTIKKIIYVKGRIFNIVAL